MVAEDAERSPNDFVECSRRKHERRTGAIDFLSDLARRLSVDVEVLDWK